MFFSICMKAILIISLIKYKFIKQFVPSKWLMTIYKQNKWLAPSRVKFKGPGTSEITKIPKNGNK